MNKGRINITLNNNQDGLKVISSWENEKDREMIERVLKMFAEKIEYIKIDIGSQERYL